MFITVAGNKKEVKDGLTVAELIEQEKVETPQYVTVSLNDEFVENNKLKLMNESSSIANMVASQDGYDVCLELVEKQMPVLTINVFIKDEEMARTLCENWKTKSSKVFDYILNELL